MSATLSPPPAAAGAVDLAAVKTRQQAAWSSGDYAVVGTTLQIVGELLAEGCDLRTDERVLDVAAGLEARNDLQHGATREAQPLAGAERGEISADHFRFRPRELTASRTGDIPARASAKPLHPPMPSRIMRTE